MTKDLTDQVTVFLIRAGNNPSYPLCRESLDKQTVSFRLEVIQDVHPISAAFQTMLDRCRTPLYIEVDEDMVLCPDSVERMVDEIQGMADEVCMCCFHLRDVHLDQDIYGVKIYKHAIFKHYPYDLRHPSCEFEQLQRIRKDGYTYRYAPAVMGQHAPRWTNEMVFERYLNLLEKLKLFGHAWMEQLPAKLWAILRSHPTEENLYAFLGAYTSVVSAEPLLRGEKDFRDKRPEVGRIRSYLEAPASATLYMTDRCNCRCTWCYRQHHELEKAPDVHPELVGKLLARFPSIQSVCLCGLGEPLLSERLIDILALLRRKGIFSGLITNGLLLGQRLPEIRRHRPGYISVSLNTATAEAYARLTGVGGLDQVLEGVRRTVRSGVPTYLSFVCTQENWSDVPEYLRLARSLGVTGVHLHNLLPHLETGPDDKDFWSLVLTKEHEPLIDELTKLPEAQLVTTYPVLIERGQVRRECRFPWTALAIDGNGSITLCNSVYPPRKENGTIDDPVLWHNAYCNEFRESICGEQREACKKCFRNWEAR